MKLKRPEWYTIEQLAAHWDVHEDMIKYYIQTKELKLQSRYTHEDFEKDTWTISHLEEDAYADDCAYLNHHGYKCTGHFIRLEEARRFEKIHGMDAQTIQDIFEQQSKMVIKLKQENFDQKQIAKKLKTTFPEIKDQRLGKLITEVPGVICSYEAYRKRGSRLLK